MQSRILGKFPSVSGKSECLKKARVGRRKCQDWYRDEQQRIPVITRRRDTVDWTGVTKIARVLECKRYLSMGC